MAKAQVKDDEREAIELPEVTPMDQQQLVALSPEDLATAATAAEVTKARNDAAMQTFVTWLTERADQGDEELYDVMASIMSDMLQADNAADLLKESTVLHAKEILNTPLILHSFDIREGSYEDSLLGFYAAMTVSRPGMDQTRIITCGATKVLMKLYNLERIGEMPVLFWFKSKPGKKGDILDIVRD